MAVTIGLTVQSEWIEASSQDGVFFVRFKKNKREWASHFIVHLNSYLATFSEEPELLLHVCFGSAEIPVIKGQVQAPGLLFTSGFENWLQLQNHSHAYGLREVLDYSLSSDRAFAINERMNAAGEMILPMDIEQLIPIAEKLKAMNIQSVCVCFLHSNRNSSHENQVQTFFNENGFRVFISSTWSELNDEIMRWSHCVVNALASNFAHEELISLKSEFSKSNLKVKLSIWTEDGLVSDLTSQCGLGLERSIENFMIDKPEIENLLSLGLEQFIWTSVDAIGEALALPLHLQPFTIINSSLWGLPLYQKQSPLGSPMILSPALRPTVFDILLSCLEYELMAVSELRSEKHNKKMIDVLYSLSDTQSIKSREAPQLVGHVLTTLTSELLHFVLKNRVSNKIHLTGTFAPLFGPRLQKLCPALTFVVEKQNDRFESLAVARGSKISS